MRFARFIIALTILTGATAVVIAARSGNAATPVTPPRGVTGDSWADVVIGQPDFSQVSPYEVEPDKLQLVWGGGVIVDRSVSPGRLYIWDGGNNRILGVDLEDCYGAPTPIPAAPSLHSDSTCSADLVIGQVNDVGQDDFHSSACNGDSGFQSFTKRAPASSTSLCGLPEASLSPAEELSYANMFVDSAGNLYVPDTRNHRVLKYNSPFTSGSGGTHNTVADEVWGQTDFTGNRCNKGQTSPDATTLCFNIQTGQNLPEGILNGGGGVGEDPQGNIWIADSGNARVLRFPINGQGVVSKTADLVLGQSSFTSRSVGSTNYKLDYPVAVRVDEFGDVYVADVDGDGNHAQDGSGKRVLKYDEDAYPSGLYSGQPAEPGLFAADMCPLGLELDDYSGEDENRGGLWVQDDCHSRLLLWDLGGTEIRKIVGQHDPGATATPAKCMGTICANNGSIGIDTEGNILVSSGRYYDDVYRFDDPLPDRQPTPGPGTPTPTLPPPDLRLFTDGPAEEPNQIGDRGLSGTVSGLDVVSGIDPETSAPFKQMIVSDTRRLLFWNDADNLDNYQTADGVIIPCSEPCSHDFDEASPWTVGEVKSDGTQLWVAIIKGKGADPRKELWVYDLPLHTGDQPTDSLILGKVDSGYEIPDIDNNPVKLALQTGQTSDVGVLFQPTQGGDFVWLSFPGSNRVVRVRDPLGTPKVDVVLGQSSLAGTQCNRTGSVGSVAANTLCRPGLLTLDKAGNLYVSDNWLEDAGNNRLLKFNASLFPTNNQDVIAGPNASKTFPSTKGFQPAFDSCGHMVLGYNGFGWDQSRLDTRKPGIYADPGDSSTQPTAFLSDFYSHPYVTDFDENDNLYVGDLNRSRVLIYRQPTCLDRPENFTMNAAVVDGQAKVTLTWDAVEGADKYEICLGFNYNQSGNWYCPVEQTSTTYTSTAADFAHYTLYYAVRAKTAQGLRSRLSNRAVFVTFHETISGHSYNSYFTVYKDGADKMTNGFNRHSSHHWLTFTNATPSYNQQGDVAGSSIWFSPGPTFWDAPDWSTGYGPLIGMLDYDANPSPSPGPYDSAFMSTLCMNLEEYADCQ